MAAIDSQLSSIFEVLRYKKNQTPHSWFWDFRADKFFTTCWSGGRVQVWVQVWAPAGHLVITAEGHYRRQSKVLTAKSNAKLSEQRSSTAWADQTSEHKHRALPNRQQSLQAATCSLEENVLPILQYWLSLRVNKVLMTCKFWAAMSHFYLSWEMKFSMELAESCCRPKQRPSLRSIFLSFVGLWVEIWHRNKHACSESNPVQSSRSKSTTSPRKGLLLSLLKFELNSTATSDGKVQMLGNDVKYDSE